MLGLRDPEQGHVAEPEDGSLDEQQDKGNLDGGVAHQKAHPSPHEEDREREDDGHQSKERVPVPGEPAPERASQRGGDEHAQESWNQEYQRPPFGESADRSPGDPGQRGVGQGGYGHQEKRPTHAGGAEEEARVEPVLAILGHSVWVRDRFSRHARAVPPPKFLQRLGQSLAAPSRFL